MEFLLVKDQFVYNIIMYFIAYSFIGWVVESIFKSLLEKKLINSGFLNGPFIPIYGVGALLIITCMTPLKDNIILLFLCGFVFMTIFEYIVGLVMEKMFNMRWWDYTGNFMNIGGKVCLENSLYWGGLAVFLITCMHPEIQKLIGMIPVYEGQLFIFGFMVYFVTDYILTMIQVLHLEERVANWVEIGKETTLSKLQSEKIENLRKLILKRSKRLLKTYPKLTYLRINRTLRDVVNDLKQNISNNLK